MIEAFSTQHAEIEATMEDHGLGKSAENPHLSAQAALMTWARKRDVDEGELQKSWGTKSRNWACPGRFTTQE